MMTYIAVVVSFTLGFMLCAVLVRGRDFPVCQSCDQAASLQNTNVSGEELS